MGIIIEISSKGKSVNSWEKKKRSRWLGKAGHITKCIVLPRGCVVEDLIAGLKFQIDINEGEKPKNFFSFPWGKILEVRTLDGRPFFRNWDLCPKCRRITKFFLNSGPFCRQCECCISQKENRESLISCFEEK